MHKKIDIKVYRDNEFHGNDFIIIKYEGHYEVVEEIYKRHGFSIKIA